MILLQEIKIPYTRVNVITQQEFEVRRQDEKRPVKDLSQITPPGPPAKLSADDDVQPPENS